MYPADDIETLARWVLDASTAVAFTGAGMSTDSGIPDFRSPGGVWSRSQPVLFDEFLRSAEARREYWRQKSVAHADFATARAGIRIARQLYGTEPMAGLVDHETLPGSDVTSDEALDEHIRAHAQVTQHPVGTCTIGSGPQAVVDPQLRVHGIAGLRVIDASVMPDVPGGNTNAPTIMIGEKAADMLRGRSLPRIEGLQ